MKANIVKFSLRLRSHDSGEMGKTLREMEMAFRRRWGMRVSFGFEWAMGDDDDLDLASALSAFERTEISDRKT